MLTKEQFIELRKKGLSIQQIQEFESGKTPRVKQETRGNQFAQDTVEAQKTGRPVRDKINSFIVKGTDLLFGGGKLAQGMGQAIAAPGVQKKLSAVEEQMSDVQLNLTKEIIKRKNEGGDTARLEKALRTLMEDQGITRDAQDDFVKSLKTTKEVVGSAARLGVSVVAPTVGKVAAKATGATNAVGALSGATRYGLAGVGSGAVVGAGYGAGSALEENGSASDVWNKSKSGAIWGGAFGGVGGAVGGAVAGARRANTPISRVTPKPTDYTEREWEDLVRAGAVEPKTAFGTAKAKLPGELETTATKYGKQITKDPVQTTNNLREVGKGLNTETRKIFNKSNPIFNKGELRNALLAELDNVDDVGISEDRVRKLKEQVVKDFIESIEGGDVRSVYDARQKFDALLNAKGGFGNHLSLMNDVKRAVRNGAQSFIKTKLPPEQATEYASKMREMTNLYKLEELAASIAGKERGQNVVMHLVKSHPVYSSIVAAGGITALSNYLWGKFFGGHTSSGG